MSETTALGYGAMVTGLGGDSTRAVEARDQKGEFNKLTHAAQGAAAQTLSARGANALKAYRAATDIIECYSRIPSVSRRIARLVTLGARVREPQGTTAERTEYV